MAIKRNRQSSYPFRNGGPAAPGWALALQHSRTAVPAVFAPVANLH